MTKIRYKYCIVPSCKNTTSKTPHKVFFTVPVGEEIRREWCLAAGRVPGVHKTLSSKCCRFICEDHFDLENDMENYMKWKLVGVGKLVLKKGILPHKFTCQNVKAEDENNSSEQKLQNDPKNVKKYIKDEQKPKSENINKEQVLECLDIEVKKEYIENDLDQKPNIEPKEKDEQINNIFYIIRYDPETGGEYLVQVFDR